MPDTQNFELPLPTEKLSYKFIMDSLNQDLDRKPTEEVLSDTNALVVPEPEPSQAAIPATISLSPDKKYFRIGEASQIVGVEPYVLRYWETEFKSIKPTKSNTGHRVYSKRDVESFLEIRRLLHEERFSIKGAKQKLLEKKREAKAQSSEPTVKLETLKGLHSELRELIALAKQSI